ncbi:putative ethanolamine kinase [Cocos nucifera]|uniref:ethanolamine kinase n=1 Tax=Cocos nucifera TaxID=13894 RepID=A0A8K0I2Q9_COCNU|nr:putative ethanolamine kinase [Cocos nucifera]
MGAEEKGWNPVVAMAEEREVGGGAPEERRKEKQKDGVPAIPSSTKEIDISLPLPEMKPRIMILFFQHSLLFATKLAFLFFLVLMPWIMEIVRGLLVLKVSVREESGNSVSLTVRLYGPNTDLVIDRKRELQALPYLSAAGFGAELLGIFKNGMVQSFINARTLSPSDMSNPKIAAEIAKQLHKFHQVEIPSPQEPQLWNDIFKFLEKAAVLAFDDSEKQAKYKKISFKEIHDEINALKIVNAVELKVVPFVSFADIERLYFIDFEYGSYSYRGYDIANHFNEYAGFDCDYSLYPDKNAQYHFFRSYLQPNKPHEVRDKDLETLYVETNTFRLASHIYWALWALIQVRDKDLETLYVETNTFRLASHIYWALWALIQAKVSPIDFDYLWYFFLRYNEYKKQKEGCLSMAQKYLSGSGTG